MVEEARLTHLAYAPEIAQVMLRRQQAEAIIAARQKIVHGAVSMVEMALTELSAKKVVELDDERKRVDGVEPDGGAVRRIRGAAGHQHRHAVHLTRLPQPIRKTAMTQLARPLFIVLLVVGAILIGATTDHLPAQIASHFGAGGVRQRLDEPRLLPAVHAGVRRHPAARDRALAWACCRATGPTPINIPNRDYWLDPARRQGTLDYLTAHACWLGSLHGGLHHGDPLPADRGQRNAAARACPSSHSSRCW